MKRFFIFCIIFSLLSSIYGQIPAGYYAAADGKKGRELQKALSSIIDGHQTVSYSSLWTHFGVTDSWNDTLIWDIYSNNTATGAAYYFYFQEDQCGNVGATEGVCYNREHTFCQSWFGGGTGAPYSDLFHIYPVDGNINSTRNNFPYGIVNSPTKTFTNGSKFGQISTPGAPSTNAFEPIDEYKGDIARSFFYMATRYLFEDNNFSTSHQMTYKSQLRPWALEMLKDWHTIDPVSNKEIERNNAIYAIQQNRNPFIDYPELVGKIWGNDSINPFHLNDPDPIDKPNVSYFQVINDSILHLAFNMPVVASTANLTDHYKMDGNITVANASYVNNTVQLTLRPALTRGKTYHLIVRNILGENMHFIADTSIAFSFGYPVDRIVQLAWTFDSLAGNPNVPKVISSEVYRNQQCGYIYLNGSHGSSDFNSSNELATYAGTTLGDPRLTNAFDGKSLAIQSNTANGKAMVFHFSSLGQYHLALTLACRRTSTGFDEHRWEWSLDGEEYFSITGVNTSPDSSSIFELKTLELSDIIEINNQANVYLRLTLDGATGNNGNNRFDNIVLHADYDSRVDDVPVQTPKFLVFPNPSKNQVTIRFIDFNHSNCRHHAYFYDISGKLILSKELFNQEENIDIQHLSKGIYMIEIINQNKKTVGKEKIIIQ